jgi:membrane protein required for colicin V production
MIGFHDGARPSTVSGEAMPTLLDAIVLVVVLISAVLAMVRGLTRELLSLASWVAAAVAAVYFYSWLVPFYQQWIASQKVSEIAAGATIFFVALIVASYITMKISDFVIDSRIGAVDRVLGLIFGAVRGFALVVISMWFFDFLVQHPPTWVSEAKSEPAIKVSGDWLVSWLPPDFVKTIENYRHKGEPANEGEPPAEAPDAGAAPDGGAPADAAGKSSGFDAGGMQRLINGSNGASGVAASPSD